MKLHARVSRTLGCLLVVSTLVLGACTAESSPAAPASTTTPAPSAPPAATPVAAAAAAPSAPAGTPAEGGRTVLVMGDSLSAAYGLAASQGWVALTAERVAKERPGWRVVNASVSGETTAGGAARIAGALSRHKPEVVVIELGGNDGLRGLPVQQMRANLERMVLAAKGAGARVLLVGMRMPPNLGRAYTERFEATYAEVARAHGAALLPFLLEPIAADRGAFQPDNIHPVAEAQPKLVEHVWPALAPLLK